MGTLEIGTAVVSASCFPTPPAAAPVPARLEVVPVLAALPGAVGMHPGLPAQLDSVVAAALATGAALGM